MVVGSYDYALVALSVVIAVVGSYAALDLAERIASSRRRARTAWLVGSAVTQGIGIWAMHYTGMFAFRLPVPTQYDWPTALLSFVIALCGTSLAVSIVGQARMAAWMVVPGSLAMGAAIVGLHYTAMRSMRTAAMHRYSPGIVALSALFAVVFSLLSLWLMFRFRVPGVGRRLRQTGASLQMGAAICLMHYTGMAAVTFMRSTEAPDWSHAVPVTVLGSVGIAAVCLAAIGLAVVTSTIDQRRHIAADRQQSLDELRALTARLQSAREEERTRVAREIHDELGQALTSINLELAALARQLPRDREAATRAESIRALVDDTLRTVRRIATDLRPGILDDLGLVAAIEWATDEFHRRAGVAVRLNLPDDDIVTDPEHATALFRILQETLTNIARHANASDVHVRLGRDAGMLTLQVEDNGTGFDVEHVIARRPLGILGMRARASLLGGSLAIDASPGAGTTITVRIPEAGRVAPDTRT